MNDALIEISARMTVHEFLLEVLSANLALNDENPLVKWDKIGADLIDRTRKNMSSPEGTKSASDHSDLLVQTEAVKVMQRFVERTRERIASMPIAQARGPARQP